MPRIRKTVVLCCAWFIISLTYISPATEFEVSVFDNIPLTTILLGSLLILVSVVLIVVTIKYDKDYFLTGIGSLITVYAGLYAIPALRGYGLHSTFGYDILSHYGQIQDIILYGSLSDDRYPASHLLVAEFSMITDVEFELVGWFIALWFYLLSIFFIAIFVWSITGNKEITITVILASFPLAIGPHQLLIQPWTLSLILVPLLLYCVYRLKIDINNPISLFFISIIIISASIIYHPITTFNILILFAGYLFIVQISFLKQSISVVFKPKKNYIMLISVAAGVMLVVWLLIGERAISHTQRLFIRIARGDSGGIEHAQSAGEAEYTLSQIFWYFFLPDVGVATALIVLSGVGSLIIILKWMMVHESNTYELIVCGLFFISVVHSTIYIVLQIYGTNLLRNVQLLIIVSPLVIGYGTYLLFNWVKVRTRQMSLPFALFIILLFSGLIFFGVATVYDDGAHMTTSSMDGHGWLLDNKEPDEKIITDFGRDRFAWYHFGFAEVRELRPESIVTSQKQIPNRLGYLENDTIALSIENGYVSTREADLTQYETEPDWRLSQSNHYTAKDIQRLGNDKTAIKIYENEEYSVWKVGF